MLGSHTELHQIFVRNNRLSGTITSLGDLHQLESLYARPHARSRSRMLAMIMTDGLSLSALSNNDFSGEIPPSLSKAKNLRELALSTNRLSGSIPPELWSLPLTVFYAENNQLSGSLFPPVFNISTLVDMYVRDAHCSCIANSYTKILTNTYTL